MGLKLEEVSYIYEPGTPMETRALEPLSFSVEPGEVLAIIGATGSGKSTLIQMMNGLNRPSTGRVLFHNEDIFGEKYDRRQLRNRVGLVFQYPEYQLFETTVIRDICFGPKNQGLSEELCMERARRAMAVVGLGQEYENRSPFELSGGEKRRAAIAGVLAMEPEILILDEPAAGLDPQGREELMAELMALKQQAGMGIVLVSHSMEAVARLADRILLLSHGKLLFSGSPREVFSKAELLQEAGLDLPAAGRILYRLKETGLPLETDALTIDEAFGRILALFSAPGQKQE